MVGGSFELGVSAEPGSVTGNGMTSDGREGLVAVRYVAQRISWYNLLARSRVYSQFKDVSVKEKGGYLSKRRAI